MAEVSGVPIKSMLKRGEMIVMVIEDDKFLREILVGRLGKEGYKVAAAESWEEADASLAKEKPHIILLDLMLPGTNGFEILALLKERKDTQSIPVIILSNLGSDEDIERAHSLGAKEYMIKANHTPHEIVDTVKRILGENYLHK